MKMLSTQEHDELLKAKQERDDLLAIINSPHNDQFLEGTRREVAHQVQRWGSVHDRAKRPADWFWLVGYLAGKCLAAHIAGDVDKAMHHTISTAAALGNWHTAIKLGASTMAPGSSDVQRILEEAFGPEIVDAAEQPAREVWRHIKTGGLYEIVASGTLEADGATSMIVYRNVQTGIVWVRPNHEFHDGRFEQIYLERDGVAIDTLSAAETRIMLSYLDRLRDAIGP